MFCPRCGHEQVSNEMQFCSRCGLPLSLITGLITKSSDQLKREKRELTGISLMMATVLMLMNFIIVFGAVTLPHMANPVFLWIWLGFVVSSLIVGGSGLVNLIRGGFFTRLKDRESRLRLMKAAQEQQMLSEKSSVEVRPSIMVEPVSVTETTTRELEPKIRPAGQ